MVRSAGSTVSRCSGLRAFRTKDITHVQRAIAELLLPFVHAAQPRAQPGARGPLGRHRVVLADDLLRSAGLAAQHRYRCRSYRSCAICSRTGRSTPGSWGAASHIGIFKLIEKYQYRVADVIGVQTPGEPRPPRSVLVPRRRIEVLPQLVVGLADRAQRGPRSDPHRWRGGPCSSTRATWVWRRVWTA